MLRIELTDDFADWLARLRDRKGREIILDRIARLARGLAGDTKPVGAGVSELRIAFGPGYRVYFMRRGAHLVVLLCGGDKSSQVADIARAKRLAAELE